MASRCFHIELECPQHVQVRAHAHPRTQAQACMLRHAHPRTRNCAQGGRNCSLSPCPPVCGCALHRAGAAAAARTHALRTRRHRRSITMPGTRARAQFTSRFTKLFQRLMLGSDGCGIAVLVLTGSVTPCTSMPSASNLALVPIATDHGTATLPRTGPGPACCLPPVARRSPARALRVASRPSRDDS